MDRLPTGTVTFLFTDIEGSTRLLQTLRDEYADALAQHRTILRDAFMQWNGVEVDTQGDSFFVAFARASDAVNAVVDAQRALSASAFPHGAEIRVRMGLHTGEPQVSDSHYVGMDVHRAARIGSAAHGGQVLLSQTTFDLIENELPDDVSLRDLGEHRLKDLRRPKHLYQLVIAGLQNNFPPIKTLDALPNNLPVQLTSFVGRDQEIGELETILAQQRLVTLTGVGGTGKTRLALQVAANVLDDFHDGVWLVELAPLSDPTLVPQTVATTLGLREQTGRAFIEMLQDYLRNKNLLLVLDNCEHLIEACAESADTLLRAAPHLKILATSREALGIAGESSYPVRSLSLPDSRHPSPDTMSQYDAVRLFIDRAISVQPNFQITNENAPAVAQICARLDGIPLAIELAAARVKGLSVEQIAARLDDRFRLLTGGSRTALPRQRTLQAAIDWSYKLLSEQERVLLRRLSVFAGGWTVEAAEFVCADDGERERWGDGEIERASDVEISALHHPISQSLVLDLLLRLVDKSLVVADTETREPRYHMLETIRQYAQEKLDEERAANPVRDRHLEWFCNYAERAETKLKSGEQLVWLDRLESDHDNLRTALEWTAAQESDSVIVKEAQLASALWRFWLIRNNFSEASHWLKHALSRTGRLLDRTTSNGAKRIRARVLNAAGGLNDWQGEEVAARAQLVECATLCQEIDDKLNMGYSLISLSFVSISDHFFASQSGHPLSEALAIAQQGVDVFETVGDKWGRAWSLFALGRAERDSNQLEQAREHYEQSLALLTELGDKWQSAFPLSHLGFIAMEQGDFAGARPYFEERLRIGREFQSRQFEYFSLYILGIISFESNAYEEASICFKQSLLITTETSQNYDSLLNLFELARVFAAKGNLQKATRILAAVEMQRQVLGIPISSEDRPKHQQFVTMLSQQMEDHAITAAWSAGRALTLEQAIELATSETADRQSG